PRRPWPATTPPAGPDNCQVGGLDLVAGRAEGDEPLEPLDLAIVVVVPDLVAFDRPAPAPSAADLAAVTGFGGDPAAQPVPHRRRGRGCGLLVYLQVDGTSSTVRRVSTPPSSSTPSTSSGMDNRSGRGRHTGLEEPTATSQLRRRIGGRQRSSGWTAK